jgi:hypothetical protein
MKEDSIMAAKYNPNGYWAGRSTDEKPTENVVNGTPFIEMDTGKVYFFDEENAQWEEFA